MTRLICQGDSITQGTSFNTGIDLGTWASYIGPYIGVDDVWSVAIGGTGYIADNAGSSVALGARKADVTDWSPDMVILWAGYNDLGETQTAIGAAAAAVISGILADLPGVEMYIIGCWNPRVTPVASVVSTDEALRTAALQAALPFVSPVTGRVYDNAGAEVADLGQWVATTEQVSEYVASDNTHPTDAGHTHIADMMYQSLKALTGPAPSEDTPALADTFVDVANGNVPTAADTGQAWGVFSGPAHVTDGYFDSDQGNGAAYLEADAGVWPISRIGARWRYNSKSGSTSTSGTLAVVTWADGGIVSNGFGRRTSCHVTITATGVQWYVRDVESGGAVTLLSTKTISPPLANDIDHRVDIQIGAGQGSVTINDLPAFTWADARIASYDSEKYACFEPYYGSEATDSRCEIAEVWADGEPIPSVPADIQAVRGAAYGRSASNATSATVTVPTETKVGDRLLLAGEWLNSGAILDAPGDWTAASTSSRTGISSAVWTKVAESGDAGKNVIVGSTAAAPTSIGCWALSGIDDVGTVAQTNQGSGSHNITVPGYTPTEGVIPLHLIALARSSNAAAVLTPPSGMTPISSDLPGTNERTGFMLAAATDWADNTTVGTVWTNTSNHYACTFMIPVVPSVTAPTTQDESGGSASTVTATATGAGVAVETSADGSGASVTVTTSGAGIVSVAVQDGSASNVGVSATGAGIGAESGHGASSSTVTVTTYGSGIATEATASGASTIVNATAAGAGISSESVHGGSSATVTVTTVGGGSSAEVQSASGGASTNVNITSIGDSVGTEHAVDGAAAITTATATGAGTSTEHNTGGSATTVTVTAHGAGLAVENVPPVTRGIDISVSVGGSRRNGEVGMSRISGTIFAADGTRLDDTVGDTRQSTTIAPTIQHRKAQ